MPFLENPAPNVREREKMEGGKAFRLETEFTAAGDQPTAIKELVTGIQSGEQNQVLLELQVLEKLSLLLEQLKKLSVPQLF